jgi:ketosteroid isomerase-like protein
MKGRDSMTNTNDADTAETNKRLALTFLDALASGDAAGIRATLADNAEMLLPRPTFTGTAIRGADAISSAMAELGEHYDAPVATVSAIVVSETTAMAEWRLQATIRATDSPYDQFYVWAFTCADGRIRELREYQDTRYGFEVMGAMAQDTLDTHLAQS